MQVKSLMLRRGGCWKCGHQVAGGLKKKLWIFDIYQCPYSGVPPNNDTRRIAGCLAWDTNLLCTLIFIFSLVRGWDNYGLEEWGSILDGEILLSTPQRPDRFWGPTCCYSVSIEGSFPGEWSWSSSFIQFTFFIYQAF
jgi:hypothetical protein